MRRIAMAVRVPGSFDPSWALGSGRWIRSHQFAIATFLILVALLLRTLLVIYSPVPFGYVWDFYHEGVRVIYEQGRLPVASDCWVCAHPPLFFLAGVPFYASGLFVSGGSVDAGIRWLGLLAMLCAATTIYYGYRLLRLYRAKGPALIAGLAILLVFPCLFISSYGAESDILLTALLSAFVYYLAEYFGRPARASWRDAVRLGALGGLAMATKASGFAAPATLAVVFIARAITGPGRQTLMRHAAITLAAMSVLGAWKYVDNWRRHGTPFHLSGTGVEGFTAANRTAFVDRYEFATFRLGALERAIGPNIQTGTTLTALDVYKSVPTTLHALAWSDMSFFSVPSRHGASGKPYPWKFIPPRLTLSVILLGAVPAALALLGFVITLRHRAFLPLSVFGIISLAAYVWWFLPQPSWALKTKYVLFLLPQYVLYSVTGLAWLTRRIPIVAAVAWVLVAMLIVLCHLYLYAFAVGRL